MTNTPKLPADERELLQMWDHHHARQTWEGILRKDQTSAEGAQVAQRALAEIPDVTALDALKANTELVRLLTGRRWYVMRDARQAGATWDEIGAAVDMSGQEARDWYRQKIEFQEKYAAEFHDAAGSRAVLED
jgi:hypothetical protein